MDINALLEARFLILDIEAIALGKERETPSPGSQAKIHNCTRKFAVLLYDGAEYTFDLEPCISYRNLEEKERNTFLWAKKNCHGLRYSPEDKSYKCRDALCIVMNIIRKHKVDVCYYKGGVIEKDLLHTTGFPMINLEHHSVVKSPENVTHLQGAI